MSTLLLTNADQIADHKLNMDQFLSEIFQKAFLPPEERNLFNLASEPVVLGELNPNHTDLLFPGSEPDKPDLVSLLQDVPEDINIGSISR